MELTKEAIEDLMQEAQTMPNSEAKLALLERAASMADSLDETSLGIDTRFDLMDVATFFGHAEKLLVAYAWCLARYDENPEHFNSWQISSLFWNYKWILHNLEEFPSVPLAKVIALHADFERRYREAGHSERSAHYYYMRLAKHRGLRDEAQKYYDLWKASKRDRMSDCLACETQQAINFQLFLNDDEEALNVAKPILAGKQRCNDIPRATYSSLLIPLLRLGRPEEAAKFHKKALPMYKQSQEDLLGLADHLSYLAVSKDLDTALSLFEKHVAWAFKTAEINSKFSFLLASHLMFKRFLEQGHRDLKVRLPKDNPMHKDSQTYDLKELSEQFSEQLKSLAVQFDQRNETTHYNTTIQENEALLERLS